MLGQFHQVVHLHEFPGFALHVQRLQIQQVVAFGAFQLPDDLVLLAILNKIAKAATAQGELQRLAHILNGYSEALGFFAVDLDPDFRFGKF